MFKVGDIVTGISSEHYGYTTEDAVMKVLSARGHAILVIVLSHKDYQANLGATYDTAILS